MASMQKKSQVSNQQLLAAQNIPPRRWTFWGRKPSVEVPLCIFEDKQKSRCFLVFQEWSTEALDVWDPFNFTPSKPPGEKGPFFSCASFYGAFSLNKIWYKKHEMELYEVETTDIVGCINIRVLDWGILTHMCKENLL